MCKDQLIFLRRRVCRQPAIGSGAAVPGYQSVKWRVRDTINTAARGQHTSVSFYYSTKQLFYNRSTMVNLQDDTCGYCNACVRLRLCVARGRDPEPMLVCAYKHILESYSGVAPPKPPETAKAACASCRWTSDAQFPETPPSSSDLSLEWSSRSTNRTSRRRKR